MLINVPYTFRIHMDSRMKWIYVFDVMWCDMMWLCWTPFLPLSFTFALYLYYSLFSPCCLSTSTFLQCKKNILVRKPFVKVHNKTSNYERISSEFSSQLCECADTRSIDFLELNVDDRNWKRACKCGTLWATHSIHLVVTIDCHAHFSSSIADSKIARAHYPGILHWVTFWVRFFFAL